MDSLEIREIEARLTKEINGIPLPLEIKRLILLEIMGKVEAAAQQEINDILSDKEREQAMEKVKDAAQKEIDAILLDRERERIEQEEESERSEEDE